MTQRFIRYVRDIVDVAGEDARAPRWAQFLMQNISLLKKQETERLLSQITRIKTNQDIFDIESAFIRAIRVFRVLLVFSGRGRPRSQGPFGEAVYWSEDKAGR
jgi:hypothetical protein